MFRKKLISAFALNLNPTRPTQSPNPKWTSYFRSSVVFFALTFSGCENVRLVSPPPPPESNDIEARFVLHELTNRAAQPGSGVVQFAAELAGTLDEIESQAIDPKELPQLDTDALTINNPIYWQAVFEMGKDRVLLFWLRGLLLALENKPGEALEWTLFVRQSVFLSDNLDTKWLNWERQLIKKLSNSDDNRGPIGAYVIRTRSTEVIEYRGTTRRVVPTVDVSSLQYHFFERDHQSDLLPLYALGYEPLFSQIFQEEGLHPRIRDAMKKTWVPWPYEALLAPDELILNALWYGRQKAHGFALVSYMGARDRADLRGDAVTKTLLESQLGAERAGSVLEKASQFSKSFSQNYIGSLEKSPADRPINPYLQKQLRQTVRRLEGIAPEISQWSIDRDQFYVNLARSFQQLGHVSKTRQAVDQLVKQKRRAPLTKIWQLRLAIREGNSANISAALESLQKSDRKMKQTALAQAEGALALGKWREAAEAFEAGTRLSAQQSLHEQANYFTLHGYICAQLSENTPVNSLETEFTPFDDFVWVNQLRLALIGELNGEALLELARVDSDFETAGRLCEAHLILAFNPDQTEAGRASNLRACLSTGRVDFLEYQMAQHFLRDHDTSKRP